MIALAMALWGCADSSAPPLQAEGPASEGLLFTASVYDEGDLVRTVTVVPAAEAAPQLSNPPTEIIAPVEGNANALYVAWIARPCEDRPSLEVAAAGDEIEITLDRGPEVEGVCASYPHTFAVRLEFHEAASVTDATLTVTD